MTPFDANLDNDARHTIDQDDLIAFHLHELSPLQERALRRVLESNPRLQAESIAIAATLQAFPKHEPSPTIDAAASERVWQAVRPLLTPNIPSAGGIFGLLKLPVARWAVASFAAAAIATAGIILVLRHNQPAPQHDAHTIIASSDSPITSSSGTLTTTLHRSATSLPTAGTPSRSATTSSYAPLSSVTPVPPQQLAKSQIHFDSTPTPLPLSASPMPLLGSPPNFTTATNQGQSSQVTGLTSSFPSNSARRSKSRFPTPHQPHSADFTLAVFGDLMPSRNSTYNSVTGAPLTITTRLPITQSAVGVLASFHQQLSPWIGYRITTTYSHPTFQYTYKSTTALGSSISQSATVTDNLYEFSGSYVVRGPRTRRLTTYAEAGAGLLVFQPGNNQTGAAATKTVRSLGTLGVSADIALSKHWAIHTEYRALLYNSPAFTNPTASTPGAFSFSSNPTVGVTYNFGSKAHE